MNLVLKIAPNENYFTEELVSILWTEFKLFISNWKRFDLYLALLKPKNRARFLVPFCQSKWKHLSSLNVWLYLASICLISFKDVYFCFFYIIYIHTLYIYTIFKVISKSENILNFCHKCASFVPIFAACDHTVTVKFGMTLQYLNIYVTTQKFPQTFLYRSIKYCESFKSLGELGKKNFYQQLFADGHFTIGETQRSLQHWLIFFIRVTT